MSSDNLRDRLSKLAVLTYKYCGHYKITHLNLESEIGEINSERVIALH